MRLSAIQQYSPMVRLYTASPKLRRRRCSALAHLPNDVLGNDGMEANGLAIHCCNGPRHRGHVDWHATINILLKHFHQFGSHHIFAVVTLWPVVSVSGSGRSGKGFALDRHNWRGLALSRFHWGQASEISAVVFLRFES